MKRLTAFLNAVLAGVCISLGALAYLSIESKVAGSLFFFVGLFAVCTNGFSLFTGKVAYVFERDWSFRLDIPIIWIGNLVGTALMGTLTRMTRLSAVVERAMAVTDTKLSDDMLSIFILAIFCNLLIFVAVDGFARNPHEIGKYIALLFGVCCFVVCGFEHCVANMFYFTAAGAWSGHAVLYVLIMTLGNSVGGVILPLSRKLIEKTTAAH